MAIINTGPAAVDTGATTITPIGPLDRSAAAVPPASDPGIPTAPPVYNRPVDRAPEPVEPGPGLGTSTTAAAVPSVPVVEIPVEEAAPAGGGASVPAVTPIYIQVLSNGSIVTSQTIALNFLGTGVTVAANGSQANITIAAGGSSYTNSNVTSLMSAFGSNTISTTGNITGGYILGNGSQLTGIAATYGNSNVVTLMSAFGSNTISTTGNITGGNVLTSAQVVATGVIQSGTGLSTGGYLSVDGSTDLHLTNVTGNLSVTGNITANVGSFFIGNGSQLTGIAASYGNANVVANLAALGSNPVSTTGNITSGNLLTGGLISVAGNITGGNISTDGALVLSNQVSYISVAGAGFVNQGGTGELQLSSVANKPVWISTNASTNRWVFGTAGNLTLPTGGTISGTGNITGGNVLTGGVVSATGNISGGNVLGGANVNATLFTGTTVSVTANVTGGNITTAGLISVTGNITAGNLIVTGIVVDNTANLDLQTTATNGNINLFTAGTGIVTANAAVSASGNVTGGNITTAGLISATGNITGGNVTTAGLTNTASLSITGNTATVTSANYSIGYLNVPQVSLAANSTIALTDSGKHYYSVSASNLALTIANNTSVAWPVGTAISIVNANTGNILIDQGTGVSLYLAGNATAGNRVLATFGMATIMNTAANVWFINGTGLT